MFEYLMMHGVNDSLKDAKTLVKLLHGIKAKVNLIYFNPHEGSIYKRPLKENMEKFRDFLQSKSVTCTIRESKGIDISAACGQLKNEAKIKYNKREKIDKIRFNRDYFYNYCFDFRLWSYD